MPNTERPTIAPRPTAPMPSITSNDLGAIVIEATRTTIERKGKMFGDEATRQRRRAELHNLIWSWWPEREVSPLFLAVLELADGLIDLASAQPGQESVVLTQLIGHLSVLATTFLAPPAQPPAEEEKREERTPPERSPLTTRLGGLGLTSSPAPTPTEPAGNAA